MKFTDRVLAAVREHGRPLTIRRCAEILGVKYDRVHRAMWKLHVFGRRVHMVGAGHESPVRKRMARLWSASPRMAGDIPVRRVRGRLISLQIPANLAPPKPLAPSGIAWKELDWGMTDIELAPLAGCTRQAVAKARKRFKAPQPDARDIAERWASVDWSTANADIARQMGCCKDTVRQWRRRLGAPSPDIAPPSVNGRPWTEQDWTLSNLALARQLGMHCQTIARYRLLYAPEEYKTRPRGRPASERTEPTDG